MRQTLGTLLEALSLGAIAAGCFAASTALGFIAAGTAGLLFARGMAQ